MRKRIRKIVWKIWQTWLILSIPLNIGNFIFWGCCLESRTVTPVIMCVISGAWLMLLSIATTKDKERRRKEDDIEIEEDALDEFQRCI